jgi:uncharacterized protein YndB with AHSA1/START domain
MVEQMTVATTSTDREIISTRTYDASREAVFNAWLSPDAIGEWWGPTGFTTTTHEMNVTPGGTWRFIMHGPDGTDFPSKITFLEVVKPERIVYSHGGNGDNSVAPFEVAVSFEDVGGKTKLTMKMIFSTADVRKEMEAYGVVEGNKQTLDRLAAYLGSK